MRWSKAGEVVSKSFPLTVGSARGLLDGNENKNLPRISKKSPTKQTNCLSQLPQIIPTKLGFVFQFLHALNNQKTQLPNPSNFRRIQVATAWAPSAHIGQMHRRTHGGETLRHLKLPTGLTYSFQFEGMWTKGPLPGYPPRIPETTSNILLMGSEDSSKTRPVEVTVGSLLHMIYKVIKYRFQVVGISENQQ